MITYKCVLIRGPKETPQSYLLCVTNGINKPYGYAVFKSYYRARRALYNFDITQDAIKSAKKHFKLFKT